MLRSDGFMPHAVPRRAAAAFAASLKVFMPPVHAQDAVRDGSLTDPARGSGHLSQVGRAALSQ